MCILNWILQVWKKYYFLFDTSPQFIVTTVFVLFVLRFCSILFSRDYYSIFPNFWYSNKYLLFLLLWSAHFSKLPANRTKLYNDLYIQSYKSSGGLLRMQAPFSPSIQAIDWLWSLSTNWIWPTTESQWKSEQNELYVWPYIYSSLSLLITNYSFV